MTVDARGLACPEPVILTKKALKDKPKCLTVLVDNVAAKENVTRFGEAMKYTVSVKEDGKTFTLEMNR